jgi:hypothetical protein
MNDNTDIRKGFMCSTSFRYELGEAKGGVTIFASEDDLKREQPECSECGIVEVEVRIAKIAAKGNGV